MRLDKAQDLLKRHSCEFSYTEEDGLGSIDLIYRGVSYYIWEFADGEEKRCGDQLKKRWSQRRPDRRGLRRKASGASEMETGLLIP